MGARRIIIGQGRGYAVIGLAIAEACALHTLAQTALGDARQAHHVFSGVLRQASSQSGLHAVRRAAEVLGDLCRAAAQEVQCRPEDPAVHAMVAQAIDRSKRSAACTPALPPNRRLSRLRCAEPVRAGGAVRRPGASYRSDS
jgi:hypothetical protein